MSNNNATVALPGHANWNVWWSPQSGFDNFQLDIVGFLAVLGESSVLANAQVAALSRLFYLPRLLPAPQALLRTSRPTTLPPTTAKVTGVYSGNVKDHVHHVANVLLGEPKQNYTVDFVEVKKRDPNLQKSKPSIIDTLLRGAPRKANQAEVQPVVTAKATGPLFWVTLIGVLEVVILFTCSIIFGDGMSLLATILLGGLSTVVGVCNKWTLELSKRPDRKALTGDGDAVIRYPNGGYLVVKCTEDVARELFFAPEEINYNIKSEPIYRLLSLLGTVMLMLGVIALANAKLQLQFGWAGAFIIINIAHWVAAALPQKSHWDLSCYILSYGSDKHTPHTSSHSSDSSKPILHPSSSSSPPSRQQQEEKPNFTTALWKAIFLTKSIAWVRLNDAAPSTAVWDAWLLEAEQRAKKEMEEGERGGRRTAEDCWDAKEGWNSLNRRLNPAPPSSSPSLVLEKGAEAVALGATVEEV